MNISKKYSNLLLTLLTSLDRQTSSASNSSSTTVKKDLLDTIKNLDDENLYVKTKHEELLQKYHRQSDDYNKLSGNYHVIYREYNRLTADNERPASLNV